MTTLDGVRLADLALETTASPIIVVEVSAIEPHVVLANRAAAELFGYDVAGLIGRPLKSLLKEPKLLRAAAKAKDGESKFPEFTAVRARHRDGSRRRLAARFALLHSRHPTAAHLTITFHPNNEVEELAILTAHEFCNSLPYVVCYCDRDLTIRFINKAFERWWGISPTSLVGRTLHEIPHFGCPEAHLRFYERALAGEHATYLLENVSPNGPRYLEAYLIPWLNSSGAVVGFYFRVTDDTQRTEAEKALQQSEARFRDVTNLGAELFWETDEDLNYIFVNDKLARLCGQSSEDLCGQSHIAWLRRIAPPLERITNTNLEAHIQDFRARRPIDGVPLCLQFCDGARYYKVHGLPRFDEAGNFTGYRAAAYDITKQIRAEQEARRSNAVKSRFLAAASHDLRQPLQTLFLLNASLDKTARDPEAARLIGNMDSVLHTMTAILDALLDISRLDGGDVKPVIETFDVGELVHSVVGSFQAQAREKGLALRAVRHNLPVSSDRAFLQRIIENLVSNAIRYTERGKLLIGCRKRGERVSIQVFDTGVGIDEEDQEAIFEEYYQISNDARSRGNGLGLGLALVKRLSLLLDHPIVVRSTPGKGSMFAIDVPLGATNKLAKLANVHDGADETGLDGYEILLIEDDESVRRATEGLLSSWGSNVTSTVSAAEAQEAIRRADNQPDLIIADYRLPDREDGFSAIASIRNELRRDVRAIVITGDTTKKQVDPTLADVVVLHKPVHAKQLRDTLTELLNNPAQQKSTSSA